MTVVNVRPTVIPGAISQAHILSGAIVSGGKWRDAADLMNHLRTSGGQLVCAHAVNETITSGNNHTFRYYTWPRSLNRRAVWVVYMTSSSTTTTADVTLFGVSTSADLTVGYQNTSVTVLFTAITLAPVPVIFEEDHNSDGSITSPIEMTLDISAGSGDVTVQRIACFEVPRARVETGNGDVVVANLAPGFAITDADESAIHGLADAAEDWAANITRKAFDWYSATPVENTTTTFASMFQLPPKVLMPRMGTDAGTTGSIQWAALVLNTTGTAEVRATAASGATSTLSVSSGGSSPVWYTGTLTVDREDLDEDAGGQAARPYGDAITFELRRVSGGTAQIYGLAVACGP